MDIDPEQLKILYATFSAELDERLQDITDGVLLLEKTSLDDPEFVKTIEKVFRAAHNIKGAARSLGITPVGEIAHQLETFFTTIQQNHLAFNRASVDLSLEAADSMHIALEQFIKGENISFDIDVLVSKLKGQPTSPLKTPASIIAEKKPVADNTQKITQKTTREIPTHETKETESIRVTVDSLDRVSTLMEEIQINKIAMDDHFKDVTQLAGKTKQLTELWRQMRYILQNSGVSDNVKHLFNNSADTLTETTNLASQLNKNMHKRIDELDILSTALQEEVRTLRLVPSDILLRPLPRLVRDIAHELHKDIELDIEESSVKMDKMIVEAIQNPIMHILRNAIDHGIEDPNTRQAVGKPPVGKITLRIKEEGDHILITIRDDGAGIDIKKIGELAVKKKMFTDAELKNLSSAAILDIIFHPSFSTKEMITTVSGRGVGLDVVKSNMVNLKGQVNVTTDLGKGTTFYLRFPLTLASERGLHIAVMGQPFVIPTPLIERVLTLKQDQVFQIEGSQVLLLDKQPVILRLLSDILGLQSKVLLKETDLNIIILKKENLRIALVVDEIINEREIVIKPLQPPLNLVACSAGGTLAGSGEVLIVLNPLSLIQKAVNSDTLPLSLSLETEKIPTQKRPHILVVDDSITTRTLEKNILENHNFQVTTAVNGKEAWELVNKQLFSLVITDVTMPIMDGFTLTETIKQSQFRDLPVIIVTSLGSDAEKKRGISAGADAYVVKNEFESEKLLEIVGQLV